MNNKSVTKLLTRKQIAKAGLNPDDILGQHVESAMVNVTSLLTEILTTRHRPDSNFDYNKLAAAVGVEKPKIIKWGSTQFWKLVPIEVNAITICSKGIMHFYKENYGHYGNYTSDYRGGSVIPRWQRGTIKQYWFISSIHKPLKGIKLNFTYNLNKAFRSDSSTLISVRPGIKKKVLNLNRIDWKLIPKWATTILCNKKGEIEIGDNESYIDEPHNYIRTYYIRPDYTQPSTYIDDVFNYGDFNYEIINHPKQNKIFRRPKS